MKIKIAFTCTLLLSIFYGYSNTDKYRLILRDDPSTTITIGWNQISGTEPVLHYGTVDHGTNIGDYTFSVPVDSSISYKGMNNQFVRLINLTPNTNYYFVIEDTEGTSQRFWFRTAPNDNSRLSFIAGGDSRNNRTPRQDANLLVSKLKPHAVLFGGDMTDDNSEAEWRNWLDDWQLTTASDGRMFPIIPARGNHETDPETIYNLFNTTNSDSYYAVTFGDNLIRIYTLNSEVSVLGDQKTWLENDLTSSYDVTWKMAQYHKPMRPHTSAKAENNNQYTAWANLFYDNNVRLVVDCDSHITKTTWPVKPSFEQGNDEGFVIDQTNGTVYTGEGGWGAPLRPNNDPKSWTRNSGSFNQFKLILVEESKIELRTINVNNASSVGEVSNTDPFTLPSGLNVFSPPTGNVVTIDNNALAVCPPQGSPCDDGNSATVFDEEDGSCHCIGLEENLLTYATIPISTSSDDAEEIISNNLVNIASSDLEMVNDNGNNQIVGLRFNNINIPEGATLLRAYIQFETDEINDPGDSTDLIIHGELDVNSNTFSVTNNNISSRTLTANTTEWNNVDDWSAIDVASYSQRTPAITDIVDEVISQEGWISGNSITFIISGTGKRVAKSFDENDLGAPKLLLYYNSNCPITSIAIGTQGVCDDSNDTYFQDLIIEFNDAPATGTLNVNGQSFAIETSPQTITLTDLEANGLEVDVVAFFSDEVNCVYENKLVFEAPSKCSLNGVPDNLPDDNTNLALLEEATLSGSAEDGKGSLEEILYNPTSNDYIVSTTWNEYGVDTNVNLGTPNVENGFKWQVNWPNVKYINYITFGGTYPNQAQPNTLWRISYRRDGIWTVIDEGQGAWIDSGIYEWGGPEFNPIKADALRIQAYSDGQNDLVSIHLRGRGGISNNTNDSATTPKATLIQYLAPGNDCGINIAANEMLYCGDSWINGDGPTDTTETKDIIIGNGTYTIPIETDIEVNNIEVAGGASVIIKEGGSLTVNGNLTNNGSFQLQSSSTSYSSLIVEGIVIGTVSYKRHVNSYNGITGNDLISSPFSGQTFGSFASDNTNLFENPNNDDQKLFGPFNETLGSYQNYFVSTDASLTLNKGVGYRAARDASEDAINGTTLTFIGNVETSGFNIPITESASSFSGWNLIGNPYPSYIDFETFFDLNKAQLDIGVSQAVYGYDGNASNGWTILNSLTSNFLIAPGQGFFVKAKPDGGSIAFTKEMRVNGSSDDFILGRTNIGLVRISIDNGLDNYETDIYFNSNATLGLDPGYDASLFGGTAPNFSVYTHLVEQNTGTPMAIQALGENDLNDAVVPLGIHVSQGESITVRVSQMSIPNTVNVYLEDTFNNTFTLLNSNTYNFVAENDINQTGRFFLHFGGTVLGTIDRELDGVSIYTKDKSIIIEGKLKSNTELILFDIHGKIIKKKNLETKSLEQHINVSTLAPGIYILQLKNKEDQRRIKKIVIK